MSGVSPNDLHQVFPRLFAVQLLVCEDLYDKPWCRIDSHGTHCVMYVCFVLCLFVGDQFVYFVNYVSTYYLRI